jgi:hypothetical protein
MRPSFRFRSLAPQLLSYALNPRRSAGSGLVKVSSLVRQGERPIEEGMTSLSPVEGAPSSTVPDKYPPQLRRVFGVRPSSSSNHLANRQEQPKFGVDGLDVAHARSLGPRDGSSTSSRVTEKASGRS